MINIKIPPEMKAALKKLAEQQFTSMSSVIKQAIEKHLHEQGIDWREADKEDD